ncbi:MAG TPA: hypothetical protein VFR06_05660 [Gallionellaceae bacterium]|nr:hypothetical protein [Gallionellaceae bacterium]
MTTRCDAMNGAWRQRGSIPARNEVYASPVKRDTGAAGFTIVEALHPGDAAAKVNMQHIRGCKPHHQRAGVSGWTACQLSGGVRWLRARM